MISAGKATMAELTTVLGTQDLENLVEIILVDRHNQRALEKARKKDKR